MRIVVILMAAALTAFAADGWQPIFNGTTLDDWKASENPGSWTVKDGAIRGEGAASNLFYMGQKCVNCEFKAEVKISQGGQARMYVRAADAPGASRGYEAQIDNSNADPIRTGSLYGMVKIYDQLIPDANWFTEHVIVEGNHVRIFVNDRQTVDYTDQNNTYISGYLGFAELDPGNVVEFKDVMMKVLPGPASPLDGKWHLNREQSKLDGAPPVQDEIRMLDEGTGIRYVSGTENGFARVDGYDYRFTGAPAYDHVSIQSVDRHLVHFALIKAKMRKKLDPHVFLIMTTKDGQPVARVVDTVSPDGKTLTREVTVTRESGEPLQYKEVFDKVD
jgi:hypothetical protein